MNHNLSGVYIMQPYNLHKDFLSPSDCSSVFRGHLTMGRSFPALPLELGVIDSCGVAIGLYSRVPGLQRKAMVSIP